MKLTSVLITGTSTGLGQALVAHYLKQGAQVYGLSRSGSRISHLHLRDARIDLGDLNTLKTSLAGLLEGIDQLDLVILNAGLLGQIEPMRTLEMDSLKDLMDVNVWSNKLLLDYMGENEIKVQQVVAISSGAAVNGNKGWGAYSLSKAALNMLIKLYAAEHQDTHFTALAPGLVDTRMQDYLCDPAKVDEGEFPSVMKLRQARGSQAMPEPEVAAANIAAVLPEIKNSLQSGDFVDMRNL
jgi:benzil reductase ((S)-benzoin forming)